MCVVKLGLGLGLKEFLNRCFNFPVRKVLIMSHMIKFAPCVTRLVVLHSTRESYGGLMQTLM